MNKKTKIPCKTRSLIAEEYSLSYQTLHRRIKRNNIKIPEGQGVLLPKSQKLIYEISGYPCGVSKEDYKRENLRVNP